MSRGLSSQPPVWHNSPLTIFDPYFPLEVQSHQSQSWRIVQEKKQQIWTVSNFALGVLLGFLLNRSPASDPTVDSTGIQCLVGPSGLDLFSAPGYGAFGIPYGKKIEALFGCLEWAGVRHPSDPLEMIAWLSSSDHVFSLGQEPCF